MSTGRSCLFRHLVAQDHMITGVLSAIQPEIKAGFTQADAVCLVAETHKPTSVP